MPLRSERGEFHIENHDDLLIAGTWEPLRIRESSVDLSEPFTVEFLRPEGGVSVEVVPGEPFRFHGDSLGLARVPFRATDERDRTVEDAFWFSVVPPESFEMSACTHVLGGFGTDVGFYINGRIGFATPQGLLAVEVWPSETAAVRPSDGYLATHFQLHVAGGYVGPVDLRSTLADASTRRLVAVDPRRLEAPKIWAPAVVGVGKPFQIVVATASLDGVVCSPVPVTLTAVEGTACHVVRQVAASFYTPFEPSHYEVVGDVVGGVCELLVRYDQASLEASFGADWAAGLPPDSPATTNTAIRLETQIVAETVAPEAPPGGGGWGGFD